MAAADALDPTAPGPVVSASSWRLLAFLTAVNVLNFVDRILITALAPLLIADLGLSRTRIGLLAGFGFVVFYSLVGLLLGVAADRWRRIPLVAAGLGLWSAMTALSGLAKSFAGLAIPRIFVGVGEATLAPAALSMLGDAFPPRRLATATGIYYAGIPLGSAAGLIASSWIAPRWGWRACFFVLGVLGVVAAVALLAVREPARRGAPAGPAPSLPRLARDLARLLAGRRDLLLMLAGGSLLVYGAAAAMHAVTWLVEERGYVYAEAAFAAGVMAIASGIAGNLAGGAFGDWCARRRRDGHLFSLIPMAVFFTPIGLVFFTLEPGTPGFYLAWFVTAAGTTAWFGPLFAAIQESAPAESRASTMAFALLAINLLGVGPGPLVTGAIGDAHGLTLGLMTSLGVVALAIVPIALALRLRARAGRG
jgi:MFS family permease